MKRTKTTLSFLLVLMLALFSCQTAPKAAPAAAATTTPPAQTQVDAQPAAVETTAPPPPVIVDPSSITAGDTGFSPLAQVPHNFLSFQLHFGRPDQIKTWKVEFTDASGTVVRSVNDTAPNLPPVLTWDGNTDDGKRAPEGNYKAVLSVDYGTDGIAKTESASFLLDITPPSGTITVDPQPFEPGDPDIMVNPPLVTLAVNVTPGIAEVSSWRLAVVHPDGRRFMDFISEDHKDNKVAWNGRAQNNAAMEHGTTYNLEAQVFDRYGNVGVLKGSLTIAAAKPAPVVESTPKAEPAPVTVRLDGKLIASLKIYFPAYSADLSQVDKTKLASNSQVLDTLAETLKSVPGARIKVIGHANKVFWQDKAKGDWEQEHTLIPLSKARAAAVSAALAQRGLDASLFELTGVGAEGALAPFGDQSSNWKNRRVEFDLVTGSAP